MEDRKQYCENLYREYKELFSKTRPHVETYTPGKKFTPQDIKPEDLMRRHEVQKELAGKCRPFLNLKPREWYEIETG